MPIGAHQFLRLNSLPTLPNGKCQVCCRMLKSSQVQEEYTGSGLNRAPMDHWDGLNITFGVIVTECPFWSDGFKGKGNCLEPLSRAKDRSLLQRNGASRTRQTPNLQTPTPHPFRNSRFQDCEGLLFGGNQASHECRGNRGGL